MRRRGPTVPLAGTAGEAGQAACAAPSHPEPLEPRVAPPPARHTWPGAQDTQPRAPPWPWHPAGSAFRRSSLPNILTRAPGPPQLQLCLRTAKATAALSLLAPRFWHPKALPGAAEGLPVSLGGPCGPCSHRAAADVPRGLSLTRGGKPPHSTSPFLLPAWGQREGGPQLRFHRFHVLSLNPGKLFFPRAGVFPLSGRGGRGCSQLGWAVPPAHPTTLPENNSI